MDILPATPDRCSDLADLFGANGVVSGCWCVYFLASGREFSAGWGAANRERFTALITAADRAGEPPMGLLAYHGEAPVGWCAAGPRSRYARALRSPLLKQRDPAEDGDVWLAPCFFVRREARGAGVTRALLSAAVDLARRHGTAAIEGFPIADGGRRVAAAEAYVGVESLFADCGFHPVARPSERRVLMRRDLAPRRR